MPPWRVLGALVAIVFAVGIVAGAAIAPAPESSLADSSSIVQRVIALLAARPGGASQPNAPRPEASSATGASATTAVAGAASPGEAKPGSLPTSVEAPAPLEGSSASKPSASSEQSTSGRSNGGHSNGGEHGASQKPIRLPPIQHVWLIMLSGSTIADATAAPSEFPYLAGQLVKQGMLLTSYSALDGYELAGDAALLPGGVGASLDVISEPSCSGTPGPATSAAPCTQGAQASPAEVDQFLRRVAEPIASSTAYRENGLIVVTFASAASSSGAPATTLALQPVAGALLLSPLLRGDARSSSPFDSLSPRTSLAMIFTH
jgi:hypothetical protein